MKTCVYPGSFSIFTLGHKFIVDSALDCFDKVYIAVATNSSKQKDSDISFEDKVSMIKNVYGADKRVEIVPFENQLIVNFCLNNNIDVLVRGLRNSADLDYERQISFINNSISNKIKTVYFAPPTELANISSSLVRSLIHLPESQFVIEKLIPKVNMKYINKMRFGKRFADIITKTTLAIDLKYFEDFYYQEGRYFHTLQHITEMMEFINTHFYYPDYRLLVATLFHDIIYDPTATDNEEKSVEEFKKFLNTRSAIKDIPENFLISNLILATKSHTDNNNKMANIIIDADLSILAADQVRFNEYEKQIRAEYSMFSDEQYKAGRIEFVKKMLERPKIFLTDDCAKLEYKAKKNLLGLLEKLENN